ncbi:hypothetical protein RRG08_029710 [Elysia crispata]|uniref:Protein kinase domain-containing protein n=1 Tax=Elysia crispata TaxID=231223 RepID=A0AAE1DRB6_9GAST|nr:hypothetical protein RRG08_029710 [Elysia crispata]
MKDLYVFFFNPLHGLITLLDTRIISDSHYIKMSVDSKRAASGHVSSDYKVQVARLAAHGNKPEEWKEYIDTVKSRVHLLEESKQKAMIEYMYFTAFKVIPDTSKTLAYANLLVDFAEFKSKYDVAEAEKLLSYCRRTLRRFAIVHVASAELELKRDNKDKAVRILHRATVSGSEQEDIINLALQRVHEGRIPLLGDDTKEDRMGSNTSPSSGKEVSEDLSSSHFSGQIGERDLLKLSLSGCRSNTQEVQQGLDILTQHQEGYLRTDLKPHLITDQKVSPPRDENQNPDSHSGNGPYFVTGNPHSISTAVTTTNITSSFSSSSHPSSYAKSLSPPKLVSDYLQKLMWSTSHKPLMSHDENHSVIRTEGNSLVSRQPLASLLKIPETPDSKQPSPAKKSLRHFYSTPVLNGPSSGVGSSIKSSIRKFHPRNPLPPPRRVKVDPALKSTWDDGDDDTSNITVSAFPLFDKESKMSTVTDVSKANESLEIQTEPHGLQDTRFGLNNQSSDQTPLSKQGTMSNNYVNFNLDSAHKNVDAVSKKMNSIEEEKLCKEKEKRGITAKTLIEGPGDFGDANRKTVSKSISSEAETLAQKLAISNQRAHLHDAVPAEINVSSSMVPCSEGSNGRCSEHPQSIDSRQEMFQERPKIVKQHDFDQQQQMKQAAAENPAYSVHSQSSNLAQLAYITPAKQTLGTGQKILYVNDMPYTVIRMVGRGGSAKVYQVFDPSSNRICALKVVNLSCANSIVLKGFKNEIALLKKLQHCDRVIKLFDSEYKESTQKLLLVLEYGEIDLDKFIAQNVANDKQLLPSTIFYFWLQMVTAVHAMHKEGVIHSDLKPPNFILVAGNVKLIDFGIANSIQQDSTSVLKDIKMGTPSYMSPEMLVVNTTGPVDKKPRYKVGKRSDVWSLGCILYQMVYGRTPFQNVPNKIEAIINPNHPIDFPNRDDPALMDVLKKCLQRDVHLRPTTGDLLKHPYLQTKNTAVSTSAATSNSPPSLESKLSLLETVFSSASPRTKEALGHKLKEYYPPA